MSYLTLFCSKSDLTNVERNDSRLSRYNHLSLHHKFSENSKLGSINKFASICLRFSDEQEISINEINEIIFGEFITKIINKLNIICIV